MLAAVSGALLLGACNTHSKENPTAVGQITTGGAIDDFVARGIIDPEEMKAAGDRCSKHGKYLSVDLNTQNWTYKYHCI
jgi:hypothetical protein